MTIQEIKKRTQESDPHYFTRKSLKFFGQTLRSFSVKKQDDGRYKISAPMKIDGKLSGFSVRFFNPETNELQIS